MDRTRDHPGDIGWGWECPRCDAETKVRRDPDSGTFRWECTADECPAVGFGFVSRRRARIALRNFREREQDVYR